MKTKTITVISHKDVYENLKKQGKYFSPWAQEIISKISFTEGISYEVAIITASEMGNEYFTTKEIRDEALKRGYITPPAELALLLREKLSDEEIKTMNISWLVTLHEPIKDSDGDPRVLGSRVDDRFCVLACRGSAGRGWYRGHGFAFLAPQVGSRNSETKNSLDTLPFELKINGIIYIQK